MLQESPHCGVKDNAFFLQGFSRLPVYLHASSNNKAVTVLNLFNEAEATFGLPSRIRCDKGGENYDVGFYMLNHPQRGPGHGSIISGDDIIKNND